MLARLSTLRRDSMTDTESPWASALERFYSGEDNGR